MGCPTRGERKFKASTSHPPQLSRVLASVVRWKNGAKPLFGTKDAVESKPNGGLLKNDTRGCNWSVSGCEWESLCDAGILSSCVGDGVDAGEELSVSAMGGRGIDVRGSDSAALRDEEEKLKGAIWGVRGRASGVGSRNR